MRITPWIIKGLILSGMVALGFFIYSNTLSTPFIFDDRNNIQNNPEIRLTDLSLTALSEAGLKSPCRNRPISNISFAVNYYFHQYHVKGYHLVNIFIHILTGIFLYFFFKTTMGILYQRPNVFNQAVKLPVVNQSPIINIQSKNIPLISFFAATIWLVHPVQTQSVTYIVQRMNSMAAMLYILSIWLYAKGRIYQKNRSRPKPKTQGTKRFTQWPIPTILYFVGSAIAGILGLGTKEIVASLPFFILLYELYFLQELEFPRLKSHLLGILAILTGIAIFLCVYVYLGSNPLEVIRNSYTLRDFTLSQRVLTELRVVIFYISLLVFPHPSRLNLDHDFPLSYGPADPVTTLLSIIAITGLIWTAIYSAKRDRLVSFSLLWFIGNLVIESSVIGLEIIFEHRNYLPSMLVCLMAAVLSCRYLRPKWLYITALTTLIFLLSYWTYTRNNIWSNNLTLWEDCVKKSPQKARPYNNMGNTLAEKRNFSAAISNYYSALKINPKLPKVHNNLGLALTEMGRPQEAYNHYSEALKIDPDYPDAYNNLGNLMLNKGQVKKAHQLYLNALKVNPDFVKARNNLGLILSKQGHTKEAISHYVKALQADPNLAITHNNMGNAFIQLGQYAKAAKHYLRAIELNPDNASAHNNMGSVLIKLGKPNEAIKHFTQAIEINPGYVNAHKNLGTALMNLGKTAAAIKHFSAALRLKPNMYTILNSMGVALLFQNRIDEAIFYLQKSLSIQPEYVQALYNLAKAYSLNKEYEKSVSLYEKIIGLKPDFALVHYNIACIYAKQNRGTNALKWLKAAVENGYDHWESIKSDKDLENIRNSSYYQTLIKTH